MVPRSAFERLEAPGFPEGKVHLTEEAALTRSRRPCRRSSRHLLGMVGARGLKAEITS